MANPLLPVLDRLHRIPWIVSAPAVTFAAVGLALAANYFTADLFHETCLNERNPLTGQFEPSNCGEGAKVARALDVAADKPTPGSDGNGETPTPKPATTPGPGATATPTPPATPTSPAGSASQPPAPTATATPTGGATTPPPPPPPPPTPSPTSAPASGVLASGTFQDGEPGHDGSGTAEIQRLPDGSLNLLLKSFSVTNGPDLQIVLSRSAGGDYSSGDLVLEKLKANNGTQNYAIPAGTDLSLYKSVIIWCRPFDVTFAYAILEVR